MDSGNRPAMTRSPSSGRRNETSRPKATIAPTAHENRNAESSGIAKIANARMWTARITIRPDLTEVRRCIVSWPRDAEMARTRPGAFHRQVSAGLRVRVAVRRMRTVGASALAIGGSGAQRRDVTSTPMPRFAAIARGTELSRVVERGHDRANRDGVRLVEASRCPQHQRHRTVRDIVRVQDAVNRRTSQLDVLQRSGPEVRGDLRPT